MRYQRLQNSTLPDSMTSVADGCKDAELCLGARLWHIWAAESPTLATALALALGSTLTWTMRLPGLGAAVTTTSSRAPGSSGLFWPPQAFTQLVFSRNADMPCLAAPWSRWGTIDLLMAAMQSWTPRTRLGNSEHAAQAVHVIAQGMCYICTVCLQAGLLPACSGRGWTQVATWMPRDRRKPWSSMLRTQAASWSPADRDSRPRPSFTLATCRDSSIARLPLCGAARCHHIYLSDGAFRA